MMYRVRNLGIAIAAAGKNATVEQHDFFQDRVYAHTNALFN
jgi:hypothetical protein